MGARTPPDESWGSVIITHGIASAQAVKRLRGDPYQR
jgi:hypothetical protein